MPYRDRTGLLRPQHRAILHETWETLAPSREVRSRFEHHRAALGRDRWHQTLTLAYRNNTFVVAGYTYESVDTLAPDDGHSCDYNVLTGKVTKDGKTLKADARTVSIQDWNDDLGQKACGNSQQ